MKKYGKKTYKKYSTRKRGIKRKYKPSQKKTQSFAKRVKRVVLQTSELHSLNTKPISAQTYNGAITNDNTQFVPLFPAVESGSLAFNRDGNSLILMGMDIQIMIRPLQGVEFNRLACRIIVGRSQQYRDRSDLVDPFNTNILSQHLIMFNGGTSNYNGTFRHHLSPLSRSQVTPWMDKTVRFDTASDFIYAPTTPFNKVHKNFTDKVIILKKRWKNGKKLNFRTANATHPDGFAPFIAIGTCDPMNPDTPVIDTHTVIVSVFVNCMWRDP